MSDNDSYAAGWEAGKRDLVNCLKEPDITELINITLANMDSCKYRKGYIAALLEA